MGRVADKVVLIDGETLAKLMIDHSVGVSLQRSYEVKRVGLRLLQRGLKGSASLFFLLPPPDDRDRRPHPLHDSSLIARNINRGLNSCKS